MYFSTCFKDTYLKLKNVNYVKSINNESFKTGFYSLLFRSEDSTSCFPTSTNSNFPIALPGPNEFEEFHRLATTVSRVETPNAGLNSIFGLDSDIPDPTAEIGVCGLRNLGNTCFMSAGLQALLSTEYLMTYFLKFDNDGSEDSLLGQFSDLSKRIWHGQYKVINPHEFKYVLGKRYAQFRDCSQHDCQEFLALLLDSLNEELLMHAAKHSKVIASRKTRKSPNPRKLLPREIDEIFISSSQLSPTLGEKIVEEQLKFFSEEIKLGEKECSDAIVPSLPMDSTILSDISDNFNTHEQVLETLIGKREMCCDSSSDSKLLDLKRVKLNDNISKSELLETDSIGSTVVEKHTQQESIINRIFQGQFESTVSIRLKEFNKYLN